MRAFFSFLRGTDVGFSTVSGRNSHTNQDLIARWGMEYVEPSVQRHFLLSHVDNTGTIIADMFSGFYTHIVGQRREVIVHAMSTYVSANSMNSPMSIPTIQSALEGLTGMFKPRTTWRGFARALRETLNEQGIPTTIPPGFLRLKAFQDQHNLQDGVQSFVKIRNIVIHGDQQPVDRFVFLEAHEHGQWFVEMLLLRMFEYSGRYRSRLTRDQNTSPYMEVPWA